MLKWKRNLENSRIQWTEDASNIQLHFDNIDQVVNISKKVEKATPVNLVPRHVPGPSGEHQATPVTHKDPAVKANKYFNQLSTAEKETFLKKNDF